MNITQEQHDQLIHLLEDTVEFFCSENMVSGECIYTVLQCYCEAKTAQFQGVCN